MHDNPILNAPYAEPRWHYATDLQGHLNYEDIRAGRRIFDPTQGGYTIPVKRQSQGSLLEVNEMAAEYGTHLINLLRQEVGKWRNSEYPDTTGANKQYKAENKHYAETYWAPAVNAVRDQFPELQGMEWRFLEVGVVRELLSSLRSVLNDSLI